MGFPLMMLVSIVHCPKAIAFGTCHVCNGFFSSPGLRYSLTSGKSVCEAEHRQPSAMTQSPAAMDLFANTPLPAPVMDEGHISQSWSGMESELKAAMGMNDALNELVGEDDAMT